MRKLVLTLTLIAAFGVILCGGLYILVASDPPEFASYNRIHVGMSVDDVEAILGPGTAVAQSEVPQTVRAVNPADERFLAPNATCRTYPTRLKPVVEGDHILKWRYCTNSRTIWIAFRDGLVCEKHYYEDSL
jgi:hypothetical protein